MHFTQPPYSREGKIQSSEVMNFMTLRAQSIAKTSFNSLVFSMKQSRVISPVMKWRLKCVNVIPVYEFKDKKIHIYELIIYWLCICLTDLKSVLSDTRLKEFFRLYTGLNESLWFVRKRATRASACSTRARTYSKNSMWKTPSSGSTSSSSAASSYSSEYAATWC